MATTLGEDEGQPSQEEHKEPCVDGLPDSLKMPQARVAERDRVWGYYQHADNLRASRTNFFLVAEAMLVGAFATIADTKLASLRLAISGFGIVYTVCWYWVNRNLYKRMAFARDYLQKLNPFYKYHFTLPNPKTGRSRVKIHSNIFLDYILPLSTLAFWLFLLTQSISNGWFNMMLRDVLKAALSIF
jgi:hypothetical protein